MQLAKRARNHSCGLDKNLHGVFTLGFYTVEEELQYEGTGAEGYHRYRQFKRATADEIRQLAQDLGLDAVDRIR